MNRTEADNKQKEHLHYLGYSEKVIDTLFPKEEEASFLTNGMNLIKGFEEVIKEKHKSK